MTVILSGQHKQVERLSKMTRKSRPGCRGCRRFGWSSETHNGRQFRVFGATRPNPFWDA